MKTRLHRLIPVLLCAALASCALKPSAPTRLYGLTPLASAASPGEREVPSVVVGPVDLPAYTRRAQLLTLRGDGEYRASANGRWAEPLEQNVTRVLAENLSRALASPDVSMLGTAPPGAALQVMVQFSEFVVTDSREAILTAYWRILDTAGRDVLVGGKSRQVEALGAENDAEIAAAMSRALATLSNELAAAVQAAQP